MCIVLHVKYPLFLSDCNETWIFSTYFRRILKYYLTKIRPVGSELFHADGRTDRQADMTKLIAAFRDFVNEPKNSVIFNVI
jgi:hypothetical protein